MFLIPPSPRLRRFHVHWLNFLFISYNAHNRACWCHLCFKKLVYQRKSELKVSWGVCDFMNHLTAYVRWWNYYLGFLGLKTWRCSKRGVVYGTSVFRTESVDGKQRKGYIDEPCLEMVIFLYIPSVLVWKFFVMDGVGGGSREIRRCTSCCLRDIKVMKTVKQSSPK